MTTEALIKPAKGDKKPAKKPSPSAAGSRKPVSKAKSSSSSVYLAIALLCILVGGGVAGFYVYRYRRNRANGDDESLLERVASDESNNQDADTSELDFDHDGGNLFVETLGERQGGGRASQQVDPDAL